MHGKRQVLFGLVLLVLLGGARAPAAGAPRALAPGEHRIKLRHQGRSRSYLVRVPPAARAGKPLPVLLTFHGAGGSATQLQRYSQLDRLADREGFLAVFPEGTGTLGLHTWNAGTCCGYAQTHRIDDVGFVVALVEDLASRAPVDRGRIYATGMSNGAMMAYRLAAERADLVAAIAPVAGAMVFAAGAPSRPVPLLHIHSVDDPVALYAGGTGRAARKEDKHPPVEETLERWRRWDGCPATSRTVARRRAGSAREPHTATLLVWGPCRAGTRVEHWRLTGAGHVWPGGKSSHRLDRLLGPPTTVIDANEEIWRFVSSFRR